MKAILISPESQTIEIIDIDSRDDVAKLIGFDTIESDEVGKEGDRLYFDEDCFLRGSSGRFQLDKIIPISGRAVIVGTMENGTVLRDAITEPDGLRSRIKYL